MNNTENDKQEGKINAWGMLSDVLRFAIDRGQFIPVAILILLVPLVYGLTPEQRFLLLMSIGDTFKDYSSMGWILGLLILAGWIAHNRWVSRLHKEEVGRISDEKKELQDRLIGSRPQSLSKKK